MGRQKKSSGALALIKRRMAGLATIEPALDLGGGISVASLSAQRDRLEEALGSYNDALAQLDAQLNVIEGIEADTSDLAVRALAAVAGRYGKDSTEYEKVGGVRTSERKKPGTKAKTAAAKAARAKAKTPA
jgi:hypothetical protein